MLLLAAAVARGASVRFRQLADLRRVSRTYSRRGRGARRGLFLLGCVARGASVRLRHLAGLLRLSRTYSRRGRSAQRTTPLGYIARGASVRLRQLGLAAPVTDVLAHGAERGEDYS